MEKVTSKGNMPILGEYTQLIETLYASLMDNKGFDNFLTQFKNHFQCHSATLMAVQNNPRYMRYGWSVGVPDEHLRWYIENDMTTKAPSIDLYKTVSNTAEGFISLNTQLEGVELSDTGDDIFKSWLTAEKVIDVAGLVIPSSQDEHMLLALQRNADTGPFTQKELTQLNLLSPHIKHALQLFNKLYQQQVDNSSLQAAINTLSRPTIVINELMQVRHINTAAETFMAHCDSFCIENDAFLITDEASHHQFIHQASKISKAADDIDCELTSTLIIRTQKMPITLTLSPMYSTNDRRHSKGVLLQIFDPHIQILPQADKIQSIFQLSHTEALLCEMLVEGLSLQEIACKRNVSKNTVREQMRKIFTKTGYNRQSELIAAILRAVP